MTAKKIFSRLASAVLSIAICISLLPASVSADAVSPINIVSVEGVALNMPVIGKTASAAANAFTVAADAPYTIEEIKWFKKTSATGGSVLTSSETFKEGVDYYYTIMLKPNDGYYFPYIEVSDLLKSYDGTLFVSDWDYQYTNVYMNSGCGYLVIVGQDGPATSQDIDNVPITCEKELEAGYTVADMDGAFTVASGEPYTIDKIVWSKQSGSGLVTMKSTEKFVAGEKYTYSIYLKHSEGYIFPRNSEGAYTGTTTVSVWGPDSANVDTVFSSDTFGELIVKSLVKELKAKEISNVSIELVQPPIIGLTNADMVNAFKVPDDAHYSVLDTVWMKYNADNTTSIMTSSEKFDENCKYVCEIHLQPEVGYAFPYDSTYTVNWYYYDGTVQTQDCDYNHALVCTDSTSIVYTCLLIETKAVDPVVIGEIKSASVTCVREPQAGDKPDDLKDAFTIADNASYTIDEVYWYTPNNLGGSDPIFNDEFVAGKEYSFSVYLKPKEGYQFPYDKTTVSNGWGAYTGTATVSGWDKKDAHVYLASGDSKYGDLVISSTNKKLDPLIDSVTVTCVKEPQPGDKPSDLNDAFTIADNAPYTIDEVYWYTPNNLGGSDPIFNDEFVAGKEYSFSVYLKPKEGYQFPYDKTTVSNGWGAYTGTATVSGWDKKDAHVYLTSGDSKYGDLVISSTNKLLTPKIISVTITGVQDAVGGNTCTVDGLVITTEPADACTIREAYWWDDTKDCEATTFIAGNSYHLVVKLKPTDGKGCFEYNNGQYVGTATFNGVDADTMMLDSSYVNDLFLTSTSRVASGQITNVAVKGVKDPVGGNTCSTDGIVVTTDVTDGCTIKEILWWDDTNDCEATTFVAGNSYHLNIRLAPAANGKGYFKFDNSNGQFIGTATVNGAPADRKELQSFTNTDLFIASESFVAIGQVTNIKVTGMKTPVAGETCSVEGLTITTDTANSCTVYDAYWWDDTNSKKAASFVAGNSYYLCVIVAPKDGYILLFNSSDKYTGTATINGTAADRMERSVVKPTGVFLTSVVMKAVDPTDKTVVFDVLGHGTAPADQKLASGSKVTKPADPSADEYSFGGWYKDSSFTEAWDFDTDTVTSDIILYAKWEQFDYKMLDGADAEWTKGSGKDLMFRSEAPFAKFVSVKVDNEIVDPSNYTATEGSTRITFRASYLETLKDGIHKLEIVSRDGKASTRFLILAKPNPNPGPNPNPKPDIPKTGDNSHIVLWTAMLVVSGCALGVILCQEFKKRKQDI